MTATEPLQDQSKRGLANPFTTFLVALQFLSISPTFVKRPFTPRELGQATALFPLVGLILGAVLLGLSDALSWVFPPQVRSALILAAWILLTGALHLDGFLDACDGLLGGFTPESRLSIMRDERIGAFALAGGVLLLLVKFASLSSIPAESPALLLAPTLGRWSMSLAITAYPYARTEGLGRTMKDHATWRHLVLATLISLAAAWLIGHWMGLAAIALAMGVVWGGARFTLQRIPGLTGDIYGAINELVEVAVLLAFAFKLAF